LEKVVDLSRKFVLKAPHVSIKETGSQSFMDKDIKKTIKALGYLSSVGMAMALSIVIGALIGYYLDKKFKTDPWLFLLFLLFGIIAAYENLIIMVRKANIDDKKNE
jgi:ATP synthase protein I